MLLSVLLLALALVLAMTFGSPAYRIFNMSSRYRHTVSDPMLFRKWAVAEQGPRPYMEDTHVLDEILHPSTGKHMYDIIAVFDGHGGASTAKRCVKDFPRILRSELVGHGGHDVAVTLRRAFKHMDDLLLQDKYWHVGNTCVVAIIDYLQHMVWFANAGDSLAMAVQKDGSYRLMSYEHKVSDASEHARIQAAGGEIQYWDGHARVQGILNVARGFGDAYLKPYVICDPYVSHIPFSKLNYFVLATDGIWDVYDQKGLVADIHNLLHRQKTSVVNMLTTVTQRAYRLGSQDNITLVYCKALGKDI